MQAIYDMLQQLAKIKWTGEIRIRFYFGQIKAVRRVSTINHEAPIDVTSFRK